MPQLKWDVDGKGETGGATGYEGPDLPKGSYVARVKRVTVGKIMGENSKNKGKPRITILMEVVGGAGADGIDDSEYPYLGHPVWDGLNIIKSGAGFVNAFLHALTDGTEAEKSAIETAFWPPNGPYAKKETNPNNGKSAVHVKRIGKVQINSPKGEMLVQITTKPDKDLQGNFKATVTRYLPYKGKQPDSTVATSDDLEDDGLMDADDLESGLADDPVDDALSDEDFADASGKDFF
jgi:hypothetical protein